MTKWAIELGEHDISFQPRTAIKAKALADFIAEEVSLQSEAQHDENAMQVDGTDITKGEYEAKEEMMKAYLSAVRTLVSTLQSFQIERIPRSQNKQADALSKLASSSFSHLG